MITNFLYNHLLSIVLVVFSVGFVTAVIAVYCYPDWRRKKKRQLRRGMGDTVSMNPFSYIPVTMIVTLFLVCILLAGSDKDDWVTEDSKTIKLESGTAIVPHTDDGIDMISIFTGDDVYVFCAEDVDYDKSAGYPTEMVIDTKNAFLCSKKKTATLRR